MIGGITYSEMRSAYEVSQAYKSCEVVIGKPGLGEGGYIRVITCVSGKCKGWFFYIPEGGSVN